MKKGSSRPRYAMALLLACLSAWQPASAEELRLAVADSTCSVMKKIAGLYSDTATRFTFVCKSSGLLAKGMRGGALEADIFVSANREWMDFAVDNGLVAKEAVTSPLGNSLIVAAARSSSLDLRTLDDLAGDKVSTILIGDPSTAPFGRYAKQAMEASGIWRTVRNKIETRKNISLLAESLAQADTATVGILFGTHLDGNLRQLHAIDPSLHPDIRYYVAPLKSSADRRDVQAFLGFLRQPAARATLRAEGFTHLAD